MKKRLLTLLLALALTVGASSALCVISLCVAALAILSATHDIAIDGYYLEASTSAGSRSTSATAPPRTGSRASSSRARCCC